MMLFSLSALALGATASSNVMDCQKILGTGSSGVVRTDVNPTGVTVPRGFLAAGAKQLCLASRGQHCEVIKARSCFVNGRVRRSAAACTYMSNGQRVSAPTTVTFASGKQMKLSGKQAQLVGAAVCFHAPQDHMVKPNDCQVRFNYKLPSGATYRWAVSSGQHNVPTGKGALDSIVVAGKGCIALRYSEKNALGRPTPISEGYHPRFAQEVRSIQVLAPRTKVCNSGEELVSDKCVPCAAGHLSRAGDNVCAKAQTCSHVACKAVTPGATYKKCGNGRSTYKSLKKDQYGGLTWMHSGNDGWKCNQATASGFFLHVFHHGKEEQGVSHSCKMDAGKCACTCFKPGLAFKPVKNDCKAVLATAVKASSKMSELVCYGHVKQVVASKRCLEEVSASAIRSACSKDCVCPKILSPVRCQSNGMTYPNACIAKCAKASKCLAARPPVKK